MKMNQIEISNLQIFRRYGAKIYNDEFFVPISNVSSIQSAIFDSLVFIDPNYKLVKTFITEAKSVICNDVTRQLFEDELKCFIVSSNPKLLFAKVVKEILDIEATLSYGVDPSAVIHPKTYIPESCFIGANCYIGDCEIGEDTFIHSGCHIYDGVKIGKNVILDSGAVIGAAGFGFVRDEDGIPYQFPQLGGVIIEDDVEIGANTCIDRGALEDTIIRKGVKIDNLVQIAHNVEIGRYTYIMGLTAVAGSVKIGEKCWIAPSYIMNKIRIGNNVTIGFGSIVLKSVPSNKTYMGAPAIPIEKYSLLQYKLKKI